LDNLATWRCRVVLPECIDGGIKLRTVSEYEFVDYREIYGSIMQFNKNKGNYIHGWYPFVEGYSKDFIRSILNELQEPPAFCLDPFAGSGTTPLELQKIGVKCASFEVNPFMFNLSMSKMRTGYTLKGFTKNYKLLLSHIENTQEKIELFLTPPAYGSIQERANLKKWNFHGEVMRGLLDIRYAIDQLTDNKYKTLFIIGLASILLEVSNVYRNGKCMSYKKKWKEIKYSREDVHNLFKNTIEKNIEPDIKTLNAYKKNGRLHSNASHCYNFSCLDLDKYIDDKSIDLVITSPPYLNSRDYTDTYMVELWMLGYIVDYDHLRDLRKRTLKSHVQVAWSEAKTLNISELKSSLKQIGCFKDLFWNKNLLNMIKGYFQDLDKLFHLLSKKMKENSNIYFNVANSAYYGIEIETDIIVAKIAEKNGFIVKQIREARRIRPSSQQKDKIAYLSESVLVLQKKELKVGKDII